MLFCYVVLHFKNIVDTEKCVDSLLATASKDSLIVVVDNGSLDGSGEAIKEKYVAYKNCHTLILEENYGFSRGNNMGYQYAKQYNPDYIIVTNNDVVFYQKDFEYNINDIFLRTNFDVLGPDVFIPRHNDHQSPLFRNAVTIDELSAELDEYRYYQDNPIKFNRRLKIHAIKNMLCSHSRIINYVYSKLRHKDNLNYKLEYQDVGLQGACLIFSKRFIQTEDKAFDPEPFLYEEEVLLFYRCRHLGYKMVYSPKIAIRHEEAASFRNANKDNIGRLVFMLKHHVAAREMLMEYLKNQET